MSSTFFSSSFIVLNYLALSLASVCLLLAGNYLYTTLRFNRHLHRFQNAKSGECLPAPHIPSLLPWIGIAPSFLTTKPLAFWARLYEWYPREAAACAMTMGGQTVNVVFNAPASAYILKDRKVGRNKFTELVLMNGFGLSAQDCEKFNEFHKVHQPGEISAHTQQDKLSTEYLLKADRVNELTAEFLSTMRSHLANSFQHGPAEVNLYEWLRPLMFTASTTAAWGNRVLDVIPHLGDTFFTFDRDMLSLFYGLPAILLRKKYANRDRLLDELVRFYHIAENESDGIIPDPATVAWDPIWGSRLARSRQIFCRKQGLTHRGMAGIELGFLFGLSSNAIPATGWMLFYIIDSIKSPERPTLYDHVMAEIEASKTEDGTLSVPLLINQPILLSTLHEVLRMYVDTLVTRQIDHDTSLPLTPEKSDYPRYLSLKANSMLMMPTYPAHTDPATWQSSEYPHHPSASVFYPYRFLTADPSDPNQKPMFTSAHTMGKFFPWGGGKTMCTGRNFAKQEMIGSVATCLSTFDFEVLNYLDEKLKPSEKFPVLRDSLPGSAMMVPGGDMKVRVKRR